MNARGGSNPNNDAASWAGGMFGAWLVETSVATGADEAAGVDEAAGDALVAGDSMGGVEGAPGSVGTGDPVARSTCV